MSTSPTALTGQNVRAEMARRSVSQATLAEHLGLSQSSLSKRLKGAIPFDVNELHAIAGFLDVAVSALLPTQREKAIAEVAS